MICELVIP